MDRLPIGKVNFKNAFENVEALIGVWVVMPTVFSRHNRKSHTMIIDIDDDKVLVLLIDTSCFMFEVHGRLRRKGRLFFVSDRGIVVIHSIVGHVLILHPNPLVLA
jgi:hypothetical protein